MNNQIDILIVEDDAVLRDLYVRKFSKTSYMIRTASNGQEALTSVKEKKPNLLLLDLNMPVMDGFSVLEKIPKEERTYPIIVITNYEDQSTRDKANGMNVDGYFVKKDMTIKSLVEMVDGLLAAKKVS